ncbi:hypothetical protein [Nonomuraea gerenzanensis]|uniref:hypothetical protein n=1 Tax=Nonomuraea gerenzanensis TaxID=93944 RepID=UPI001CD9A69B|nr:hypothetical protein [Nonomuraea gerenzanensis]UBU18115.1 hypothetical protein LCN96_24755 [Nonomuraea gerenzanensis]
MDGVANKALRANLIEKLEKTPAAVIRIGSILIVKTESELRVRELTAQELQYLEANPGPRKDPATAAMVFSLHEGPKELSEVRTSPVSGNE